MPALADASPVPHPWRDLRTRAFSAAVLAPVALLCLWAGGLPWALMVALLAVGLCFEWVTMAGLSLLRPPGLWLLAAVAPAVLAAWAGQGAIGLVVLLAVAAWLAMVAGRPVLAGGALYVGIPAVALFWLRADPVAGRANIGFIVLVVWASDIGAYLAGRLVGGPRLAPAISPGKTWSGAGGGLVAAMLIGAGLASAITGGHIGRAIVVAATLGMVAQAGDLLESAVKRHFGVKDSGRLIPGHGGLFDRLDGILAAACAAGLLALALGRGGVLWQ